MAVRVDLNISLDGFAMTTDPASATESGERCSGTGSARQIG